MYLSVLYLSAGDLFDGVFSLWVSLIGKNVSYASQKKIILQLYLLSNLQNMIQIERNLHFIKLQKICETFTNIVTYYQQFFEYTLKTTKQFKI